METLKLENGSSEKRRHLFQMEKAQKLTGCKLEHLKTKRKMD
jgi:hypothetical protein